MTGKREEVFILNRVFTVKNWAQSYYVTILGDLGADKGGEGKSKRAENIYMERRKVKNGKNSPWGQSLTRPVSNGRRRSGF